MFAAHLHVGDLFEYNHTVYRVTAKCERELEVYARNDNTGEVWSFSYDDTVTLA